MKKNKGGVRLAPMSKPSATKVGDTLVCRICKEEKTLDNFSKINAFYYDKKCKACKSIESKEKWANRDRPMF